MPKAVQKTSVGRRIFISYCHADYPHALRLHRALTPMCTQLGDTEIFLDSEALKAGNLWEAQIRTALEEADVFIVLLSHAYNASSFCRETELRRMFERRRQAPHIRVIGVALHSVDLDDFFVDIEGERVAVMVDEILGQQQVVIKSMEQNFRKIEGVAGATILGDGTVGFILDVRGLLNIARQGNAKAA